MVFEESSCHAVPSYLCKDSDRIYQYPSFEVP